MQVLQLPLKINSLQHYFLDLLSSKMLLNFLTLKLITLNIRIFEFVAKR